MNEKAEKAPNDARHDRRGPDRPRDEMDWESKVIGRVGGHLRNLPKDDPENPTLGWEAEVLDTLRRKIERESK